VWEVWWTKLYIIMFFQISSFSIIHVLFHSSSSSSSQWWHWGVGAPAVGEGTATAAA